MALADHGAIGDEEGSLPSAAGRKRLATGDDRRRLGRLDTKTTTAT